MTTIHKQKHKNMVNIVHVIKENIKISVLIQCIALAPPHPIPLLLCHSAVSLYLSFSYSVCAMSLGYDYVVRYLYTIIHHNVYIRLIIYIILCAYSIACSSVGSQRGLDYV